MSYPSVSVLMTAYNRQRFIAEAIESVLASSYQDFELIIVDDCSKDNTVAIAKCFESKDNRIKVFVNEKNLGDYPNRNYAASLAKGEYIIYVDSDDKILKDGIELLVKSMVKFPAASFGVYSPEDSEPYEINSVKAIHDHFFKNPFLMIGPGGTIQRLSFFKRISGYPEKYGPANDMYYNLKACCYSAVVMLPFEFMYYRRHEGQEINNSYSYLYNNYLYLKAAVAELPLNLSEKELVWIENKNKRRFLINVLKYLFKTGNISRTRNLIYLTKFRTSDVFRAIFQY